LDTVTDRTKTESSGLPILVIEDEAAILRGLLDVLAFHGYEPEGCARGDLGLDTALDPTREPALVVLDVMLPGMNGFDVCEKLREARPTLPILMLTARGSEDDVLRGFRCGADDYVTKPFSVAELVARVEALIRRSADGRTPAAAREPFAFGAFQIQPDERVAVRGEQRIDLTPRDLELLALFARETGRIVSRRHLLAEIWGYPDPERVETRSVDMHIAKLRKKLEPGGAAGIETVRGEGYRFRG
jgi:two-component system response regulator RegX3